MPKQPKDVELLVRLPERLAAKLVRIAQVSDDTPDAIIADALTLHFDEIAGDIDVSEAKAALS